MTKGTNARTDSVRVKFSAESMQRLEKVADNFGMPVSTLCAFAVMQWLQGQELQVQAVKMAVLDMARRGFDSDGMEKVMQAVLPHIVKIMADQGHVLPLDHVEAPLASK